MKKRIRKKASELPSYQETLVKNRLWKRANSEAHNRVLRNCRYKWRYGITLEDYERMFAEQNGVCKICKSSDPGRKQSVHLAVDHCHITGKIRGLLCLSCNKGLSCFKDEPEMFLKAIKYLEESK